MRPRQRVRRGDAAAESPPASGRRARTEVRGARPHRSWHCRQHPPATRPADGQHVLLGRDRRVVIGLSTSDAAPTGWGGAAPEVQPEEHVGREEQREEVGMILGRVRDDRHLKHDVGEANCNAELLWLQTLERYGTSFAKHWEVVRSFPERRGVPDLPADARGVERARPLRWVDHAADHRARHVQGGAAGGVAAAAAGPGGRPRGWTDRERSEVVGSVEEGPRSAAFDREGSVTCELNPRVQPMQLFNKSFEQIGAPPARPTDRPPPAARAAPAYTCPRRHRQAQPRAVPRAI